MESQHNARETGDIWLTLCENFADKVHSVDLEARFQLVAEGDSQDRIFQISKGKIKLTLEGSLGHQHLLRVLGPGDVLGLSALALDSEQLPGHWFASATTMEATKITWVRIEHVRKFLDKEPQVELSLLRALNRDTRSEYERAMVLRDVDVPGRLAAALLALRDKFGQTLEGGAMVLPRGLTQLELAQMVGASRETANKVLSHFNKRGWVAQQRRSLVILDSESLERRAR